MPFRTFVALAQRFFTPLTICATLTGCGSVDYDAAPVGEFTGSLFVMWIGEGDDTGSGRFVYVPDQNNPLRFTRGGDPAGVKVIEPEIMYTDGGSIPKQAQLFKGFSPWGYAPAYMVHDWIYVARHCLTDGKPTAREETTKDMTFQDSADLTAEMIKTLIHSQKVSENDVASRVVSGTVAGPASYQRWTIRGACDEDRVSEELRREVESALFAPRALVELRPALSTSAAAGMAPSTPVQREVKLITVIDF
ncbi:hypothetical protein FEE96_17065 [Parasedimentitalea maritima]|uniref:DUF1353 domain-containing protein n=1 Tax=Parasedimentitalea maritima TaxID=2578117 RepID=A0ABY2UVD5_9RHOB|nr:hypothetical protein [Zongyanglinia marina]TLP59312.1 hypothetical protein FEE96_17065 [Zongyanglinia marina]